MTELPEFDDPEACYRRGYQQGAKATLDAVTRFPVERVRGWIGVKLAIWRYHDPRSDRRIQPPNP